MINLPLPPGEGRGEGLAGEKPHRTLPFVQSREKKI